MSSELSLLEQKVSQNKLVEQKLPVQMLQEQVTKPVAMMPTLTSTAMRKVVNNPIENTIAASIG